MNADEREADAAGSAALRRTSEGFMRTRRLILGLLLASGGACGGLSASNPIRANDGGVDGSGLDGDGSGGETSGADGSGAVDGCGSQRDGSLIAGTESPT